MYRLPNDYSCKVCAKSYSRLCKLRHHMTFHTKGNQTNDVSYSQSPNRFDSCRSRYEQSFCTVYDYISACKDRVAEGVQSDDSNETKKTSTEGIQNSEVSRKRYEIRSPRVRNTLAKKDASGKIFYECEMCKQRLTQLSSLKSHMRKHTGERPYKCKDCLKSFTFYQCLWNHARKHTGEKGFQCKFCLKRFVYYQCLWNHEKIHTGEKPHECGVCGKRFTFLYRLKAHSMQHTGERPYKCTICMKRFSRPVTLKVHYQVHSEERRFGCTVCMRRFKLSSSLESHRKWHSKQSLKDSSLLKRSEGKRQESKKKTLRLRNKKDHQQRVCKRRDVESKSIADPVKTSQKEKLTCRVCGKNLESFSRLIHSRIHTSEKLYKCSTCTKALTDNSGLWRPKKVHAGENPYNSKACEKNLVDSFNQKSRPRSPSSKDGYQRKKSTTRMSMSFYTLKNHSVRRGGALLWCRICNRKFVRSSSWKRHVMKHSNVKEYACEDCNRTFKRKGWLIRHCKFVHKKWYGNSSSMGTACKQCGSVFVSVEDAVNHQKCIKCRRCNRAFYCTYTFCCHTSSYSCRVEFGLEASAGKDTVSCKTVFMARPVDEVKKEDSVVLPCSTVTPVEGESIEVNERRDVLQDDNTKTNASSSQVSTGPRGHVNADNGISSLSDCDIKTDLREWVGHLDQLNDAGVDGKSTHQELRSVYIWDTTYITTNTVCNKPMECNVCGEVFASETAYTYHRMQHFLTHDGLQCLMCGEVLANEMDLAVHAIDHITNA